MNNVTALRGGVKNDVTTGQSTKKRDNEKKGWNLSKIVWLHLWTIPFLKRTLRKLYFTRKLFFELFGSDRVTYFLKKFIFVLETKMFYWNKHDIVSGYDKTEKYLTIVFERNIVKELTNTKIRNTVKPELWTS